MVIELYARSGLPIEGVVDDIEKKAKKNVDPRLVREIIRSEKELIIKCK